MRFLNRRQFLHDSAALAAAAGTGLLGGSAHAAARAAARKQDVNDRLHVAVIGVHGRGGSHVQAFAGNDRLNTIVTTICDADEAVIGNVMKYVEGKQGRLPRYEQDLRKVLEDKSIDVISIATPNHWHALAAIWAIQHGKDVYVEKPVSHNVSEGRRIVEAARKYNKICQTGTQSRSSTGMRAAMDYLHAGNLGHVKLARGLCYKLRPSIGKVDGPQPVPKTVNYDLWTGPAPLKPVMRKHFHYDWHWFWDYGNGDLGNQGIHEMDKARWGLGKNELPQSVVSVGGRFGYKDDGQTANTQIVVLDYGDCELIFEVRGLPTKGLLGAKVGNIFYGTEGTMVCPSYSSAIVLDPKGKVVKRFEGDEHHFDNFIKAVRSRRVEDLNADILEGHLSSALCHLGNVSYRLGSEQPFSQQMKAFGDDKEAYETLARMEEHLKENRVPLDEEPYRVGQRLALDPKAERFVGNAQANAMLTREYRKGFEVPEQV